jgi:hypothetical protein
MSKKLKINGIMRDEDILWKKLKCKCDKSDIEKSHPIFECKYCKCQAQEDSMPREEFLIQYPNQKDKKLIKEITIDREPIYNSIRGWSF